jgi:hypothetical protein
MKLFKCQSSETMCVTMYAWLSLCLPAEQQPQGVLVVDDCTQAQIRTAVLVVGAVGKPNSVAK